MKNVLQEIHDRSMWQILGLYLGGSWVVLQVVDTVNSTVGMPAWVVKSSFVLLALGLPIVLTTAFVQRGWAGGWRGRGAAGAATAEDRRRRRLFSWRNALLGGVSAFALLGIGTAGWLVMRTAGIGAPGTLVAKGVLDEKDRILLADFENSTDDATLGNVVTEALRVDLSQSAAVELADRAFVSAALERMERPADTPLTEDVAYELAEREGIPAIVTGEIGRVGGGYVLSARLAAAPSGEVLVSHRESAKDSTQLLGAIDGLAHHMRERIGDPLRSIAASPPLAHVTTANLDALRAYSEARRLPQADAQRRITLYEQAVALDSTFAMAWYALGIALGNYGVEPGRVMQARTRAFELKDRLTEEERNAVANQYYMGVTNEPRQAIPYLEASIEADPTHMPPVNNLGEAYRNIGDLETALDYYHRAVAFDTADAAIPLMNIAQVGVTAQKWAMVDSANALLDEVAPPFGDWHRAMAFAGRREFGPAEETMRRTTEQVTGSAFLLAQTTWWLAAMVTIRGRLADADELWKQSAEFSEENGSDVEALRTLTFSIAAEALVRRSTDGSSALNAALARYPLADMDPVTRPYLDVASAYAAVGDPAAARKLVEEFERTTPADHQRGLRYQYHEVLGEIAIGERRYDEAIAQFRQSSSRPQEISPMVNLARTFDAAGQADSARVYYRQFLDSSHWLSIVSHAWYLALSLERLARLEEDAGDPEAAAPLYAEFVSLWENADPELQPRVEAARQRLEAIVAARG